MQHIQGISRQQLRMSSLEDTISQDNPVRFIEAFVENISIDKLGFTAQTIKSEGRPSFDSKVFLKIYLYGYLNGLRSSRKLEKECIRNLELQWLLSAICPNYHSISAAQSLPTLSSYNISFFHKTAFFKDRKLFFKFNIPQSQETLRSGFLRDVIFGKQNLMLKINHH
jgi:hypothetical protein